MITMMNSRLLQFLNAENITQAQFADSIGVARASISHIISGRNKPSYEFIAAMMRKYPQVNPEWLMLGNGRMYKDSDVKTSQRTMKMPSDDLLFPADYDSAPTESEGKNASDGTPIKETKAESLSSPSTGPATHPSQAEAHKVSKVIVFFDDGTFQEMPR